MFQIFSQRDPRWANHALGSGAGEMGAYGCYEVDFTMIARDAYPDMQYDPASFDDTLYNAGVFIGDILPDNALDRVWPDRFATTVASGFDQARVNAAVASPDTYAVVCIHNPAAGVSAYHFMVMYTGSLVADPWWGKVMTLASWGGPGVVVKTIYVKSLRAQRDAAIAAAAKAAADKAAADAAAQAAADAKAAADAAAAKAAADAEAARLAAEAAAKAAAEAAAAQAAADAKAAADAAAAVASVTQAAPLLDPPTRSLIQAIIVLLTLLLKRG